MIKLDFTKMQGAGNDFVVLNGIGKRLPMTPELVRALADRRFGVGADQVLLLEEPAAEGRPLRYRIFNNVGGEVEQCGNGARCIGRFALDLGYGEDGAVEFETMKGRICVRSEPDGRMVVDMGVPRLAAEEIPFRPQGLECRKEGCAEVWSVFCPPAGRSIEFTAASMGNPHATLFVEDLDEVPVEAIGQFLQASSYFPESVNVGFVERERAGNARIRVYERGSGETLACGTGTCAAMVSGVLRGFFGARTEFAARGGRIACAWEGPGKPMTLIGPAEKVFDGTIVLDI